MGLVTPCFLVTSISEDYSMTFLVGFLGLMFMFAVSLGTYLSCVCICTRVRRTMALEHQRKLTSSLLAFNRSFAGIP